MAHVKNAFVDLADWPKLDEIQLVPVLPAYAKARALVWGVVTVMVGTGLCGATCRHRLLGGQSSASGAVVDLRWTLVAVHGMVGVGRMERLAPARLPRT